MKTRYLAILATLTFLGFSAPAAAHECSRHGEGSTHKHCADPAPEPSGGGKALLFETDDGLLVPGDDEYIADAEFLICGGTTDPTGDSHGQFSVSGNVLWDENNIHVHFKLQLKDVDPGEYQIFGNNGIKCPGTQLTNPLDFPAWEGGFPDVTITVKQNRQGRTSGVLRLPGCDPDETTSVWVTVPVTINGFPKFLRSTPVTVVLPPNEVGTGTSCPE